MLSSVDIWQVALTPDSSLTVGEGKIGSLLPGWEKGWG